MSTYTRNDWGRLILRLTFGGLMLFHGVAKITGGVEGLQAGLESRGLPGLLVYGVYVGEVLAPLALIAGVLTRTAGCVLAFNMVVAIYVAHPGDLASLTEHGGWAVELPVLFLLGGVAIALLGPGRIALRPGGE